MKKKIIFWTLLFVLLQLIKMMTINDYAKEFGENRLCYAMKKQNALSYKTLKMNEGYAAYQPILINSLVEPSNDSTKQIKVVGTNSYYEQLEHLQFVDGAFFGEGAVEDGSCVAIISDELSNSLFGSDHAVGNIFHIEKQAYKIVGVYKEYRRLRDYQINSGYEEVYVPLTSSAVKKEAIQMVVIDGSYQEVMPNQEELGKLGLNEGSMIKRDHTTWLKTCKSIGLLPMVVVWLIVIIGGWSALSKQWGQCYGIFKEVKERRNLVKIIGIMMGWVLGYLFVIGFGGYMSIAQLYIRADALPPQNVFDLTFYFKVLTAEWRRHEQIMGMGLGRFENAVYLLKSQLHIVNIVQYMCLANMTLESRNISIKHKNGMGRDL